MHPWRVKPQNSREFIFPLLCILSQKFLFRGGRAFGHGALRTTANYTTAANPRSRFASNHMKSSPEWEKEQSKVSTPDWNLVDLFSATFTFPNPFSCLSHQAGVSSVSLSEVFWRTCDLSCFRTFRDLRMPHSRTSGGNGLMIAEGKSG